MDVTIRRGTVNDAQSVIDVINSIVQERGLTSIYPALTIQREEAFIEGLGPRSALFVAETSGAILGVQVIEPFAGYTRAMDHVATMGTFVYRNFRGRGVGRKLMERTLAFGSEQGYEKIIVFVRASNSGAQAFYREMGFIPKLMLERQIKIGSEYDDEILMETFITPGKRPVMAEIEQKAAPEPEVVAPPPAPSKPAVAVDPVVGAVTVRRARRRDVKTLAAIMKGTMRWRHPPAESEVLEWLFDKGYWLVMSRKGGGLTGWRAENLVMCIDEFYVYPPQYHAQLGGPLLETVETEAKELACEVAIVFLEKQIAPQAVDFFESHGYERQEMEDLYRVWRGVAREFLTESRFMMVKRLRERRVMRPL